MTIDQQDLTHAAPDRWSRLGNNKLGPQHGQSATNSDNKTVMLNLHCCGNGQNVEN